MYVHTQCTYIRDCVGSWYCRIKCTYEWIGIKDFILGYGSFAAVQVSFAQQSYTITEGGAVNITLVTSTDNYEFDFTVTLLPLVDYYWYWNGYGYEYRLATGESCSVTYMVTHIKT